MLRFPATTVYIFIYLKVVSFFFFLINDLFLRLYLIAKELDYHILLQKHSLIKFYHKPDLYVAAPKPYTPFFEIDCKTEKIFNVFQSWTKYFSCPCILSHIMMLVLLLYFYNNFSMLSIKENIEKFITFLGWQHENICLR